MKQPKIVFLDRDGVINRGTPGNYIRHLSEFKLLPGVKQALSKLTHAGYEIHIISNQQGVAKGLMTRTQLSELTQILLQRVEKEGGKINSVNYCIHLSSETCKCRKPKTGLFKQAMENRKIDYYKTWMVGDSWRDIEAGRAMGCKTIWIGKPKPKNTKSIQHEGHLIKPDYVANHLPDAVKTIFNFDGKK